MCFVYSVKLNVMRGSSLLMIFLLTLFLGSCDEGQAQKKPNPYYSHTETKPLRLSDARWKEILSPALYHIAREQGTDWAFSSRYHDNHAAGMYYCASCGHPLFSSTTKFESGTGWPSFFQPLNKSSVRELSDADGYRTEVRCARCDAHLGHVFEDGPKPTGLRYCMNGTALDFVAGK
jgi:peptide-methionine (R)-S-oxide reductase